MSDLEYDGLFVVGEDAKSTASGEHTSPSWNTTVGGMSGGSLGLPPPPSASLAGPPVADPADQMNSQVERFLSGDGNEEKPSEEDGSANDAGFPPPPPPASFASSGGSSGGGKVPPPDVKKVVVVKKIEPARVGEYSKAVISIFQTLFAAVSVAVQTEDAETASQRISGSREPIMKILTDIPDSAVKTAVSDAFSQFFGMPSAARYATLISVIEAACQFLGIPNMVTRAVRDVGAEPASYIRVLSKRHLEWFANTWDRFVLSLCPKEEVLARFDLCPQGHCPPSSTVLLVRAINSGVVIPDYLLPDFLKPKNVGAGMTKPVLRGTVEKYLNGVQRNRLSP